MRRCDECGQTREGTGYCLCYAGGKPSAWLARARNAEAEVVDLIARHGELADRTLDAEVEVARLRAVLETLGEYLTTGASHEALRVVVFDALHKEAP